MKYPKEFSTHKIHDNYLLIYAEKPAWVILNNRELDTLKKILGDNKVENPKALDSLEKKCFDAKFFEEDIQKKEGFEFDIYELHLILTHSCNLKCSHCYMEAGEQIENELTFEELQVFLIKLIEATQKKFNVVISGGEPFCVSWLPELISFLSEHKCCIDIYTNGTLINSNFLDKYHDKIDSIQIGMEGISNQTYETIRKKSDFSIVKNTISLIKSYDIHLTLAIIIMPHNFDELKNEIRNFIDDIFYEKLKIRIDAEIDWEGRAEKLLSCEYKNFYNKNMEEILIFISDLYKWYYQKFDLDVQSTFVSGHKMENCGIGLGMTIESSGDIYPCFWNVKKYGNLRNISDIDLKKLVSDFIVLNNYTVVDNISLCNKCDLKYICTGGCKVKNLDKNDDYNIPICSSELKQEYYLKLYYGI